MAFNIVLHTIFIKLGFELDKVAKPAWIIIGFTIVLSYVIILLFGFSDIALTLDPELVGIMDRSVNISSMLLLFGTCSVILFLEWAIMSFRFICHIVAPRKTD